MSLTALAVQSHAAFNSLEAWLRMQMRGRSLLCEAPFKQSQCDTTAKLFAEIIQSLGTDPGRRYIIEHWPLTYAVWLANEAFYHYQSGAYWPFVLEKLGVKNAVYSSKFGKDFMVVLDRFDLPRFKRMVTGWHHLGPILAHAGVPKSCLPEYFETVLPKAIARGVYSREGFETLQNDLPKLRLTRAVEWFIMFGDSVAEDFVRRSADLYRAQVAGEDVEAAAARLPERVRVAFGEWWTSERRSSAASVGNRPRRPVLTFDPWDGVHLTMPSQACVGQAGVLWRIQIDSAAPEDIRADRLPGETVSEVRQVIFAAPFGALAVRLIAEGREEGFWAFEGVTQQRPALFFDPDSCRVLTRGSLSGAKLGVVYPKGGRVVGYRAAAEVDPPSVGALPPLRLGWAGFVASVLDLAGCDQVAALDAHGAKQFHHDLREVDAYPPQLVTSTTEPQRTRDGVMAYESKAPRIRIALAPGESSSHARASWTMRVAVSGQHTDIRPRQIPLNDDALQVTEADGAIEVDLAQLQLLGDHAFGAFEISLFGPMGRDARFTFLVRPRVVQSVDAANWSPGAPVTIQFKVPAGVRIKGADATADALCFQLAMATERVRLTVATEGYGGREWILPLDVQVAFPSWALFEPARARHLLEWSGALHKLSVAELEGIAPTLLLRLGTPWGLPTAAEVILSGARGVVLRQAVAVDEHGGAALDLTSALAAARQQLDPRLDLDVCIEVAGRRISLKVITLEREWRPDELDVQVHDDLIIVRWNERFPVEGRAIQVVDLFQPWLQARPMRLPSQHPARFEGRLADVMPKAGMYRVSVGIDDDWTGTFLVADSRDVPVGTSDEWRKPALYPLSQAETALRSLLIEHYADAPQSTHGVLGDGAAIESGFAEKVLQARISLGFGQERDRLSQKLGRLLWRSPLEHVLHAVAAQEGAITPQMVLQLGFFVRPARLSTAISDVDAEALWRIWPPLGAWADLLAIQLGDQNAENRILRTVGVDTLRQLAPVAEGSRVSVHGVLQDGPVVGRLESVVAAAQTSPFVMCRLGSQTELLLVCETPEVLRDVTLSLSRSTDSDWIVSTVDSAPVPAVLDAFFADPRHVSVDVRYPNQPEDCSRPPDQEIVGLVRAGRGPFLRDLEAHCSPLPSGPLGGEAFQVAGFDWTVRAASDSTFVSKLAGLCRDQAIPIAHDAVNRLSSLVTREQVGASRIAAETVTRTPARHHDEPLLAVHLLSWLTATALIFRGLALPLPFISNETRLLATALSLQELAPRLLEHDLTKVCMIQALASLPGEPVQQPSTLDGAI